MPSPWDTRCRDNWNIPLTFHNYTNTRASVEEVYRIAAEASKKFGKPMMSSATGCIARGNPYDMVLQIAQEHKTGWYLFNLIIQGYWGEIHGLFYPDGTVRAPAAIAAVMGFYRNRDLNMMIRPVPNREGAADRAVRAIEAALKGTQSDFRDARSQTDTIPDAAEQAANLLEAAEMRGGEVRVNSWVAIAVDVQSTHVHGILGTGASRRAWGLVAAVRTISAASAHASGCSSDTDRCDCALVSDHVNFQRTRQGTHG